MQSEWKFADPQNTAVITTKKIIEGASIMFVSHDEDDGGWQFLEAETAPAEADAAVVGLKDVVAMDDSILELADLPVGWSAKRDDVGGTWRRIKSAR
jgi:hypothetical protein